MDLQSAKSLALSMMAQHGLCTIDNDWVFRFDRAVRRFGCCYKTQKIITLSETLTLLNDEKHVRSTMLHEIAHALAPLGAGHGPHWRKIALSIGDDGARCYSHEVTKPTPRFLGTCPACLRTVTRNARKSSLACGACCRAHNGGKHSPAYMFHWKRQTQGGK